jgi:hypothetical protein
VSEEKDNASQMELKGRKERKKERQKRKEVAE